MYLPKRVSTRASWGLSTFRPHQKIQPKASQRMERIANAIPANTVPAAPSSVIAKPNMHRGTAAIYSRMVKRSTGIPLFLVVKIFSSTIATLLAIYLISK